MAGDDNSGILIRAARSAAESKEKRPRARDLGVPFEGTPGPLNAITDVAGAEVGFTTLISGSGNLVVGHGPVRTGVTAILPRGKSATEPVFAAWFSLNGNGEMTGTAWVEESGSLEGPIMITNTHSVGMVRDAVIAWQVRHGLSKGRKHWFSLPVVAETYDGYLNDINGFHIHSEDVFHAIDTAKCGPVEEGNVGGGTGMICYEFKGGTGTASRRLPARFGGHTLGALAQCNCGRHEELRIAGVPVGQEVPGQKLFGAPAGPDEEMGSIIIVLATDAPLIPTQLKRLARRASLGLARTGSVSGNGSGDLFIAFSTANPGSAGRGGVRHVEMLSNNRMDPLFSATVEAAEEAIVNALVAAETMMGINNHTVEALPHEPLRQVLQKYHRLRD